MKSVLRIAAATLAATVCSMNATARAANVTPDARQKATQIFTTRCATCHGPEGRGNGPAAANLSPKPRDFHSHKWQKSITDDKIAQAIVHGGKSVGVSGQMAPNPDLENEPGIVSALIERIRSWGKR